jgi:hypothetical protein
MSENLIVTLFMLASVALPVAACVWWLRRVDKGAAALLHGLIALTATVVGWLIIIGAAIAIWIKGWEFEIALADFVLDLFFRNQFAAVEEITEAALSLFSMCFGVAAIGVAIATYGRRAWILAKPSVPTEDSRPPVVYLRAFGGDKEMARRPLALGRFFMIRSEEEQLVQALREIGPVVAIGRPGEGYPLLGASRLYFNGEEWRSKVLDWFSHAALVVIRLPLKPSEGVLWEISSGLKKVPRGRLVFLIRKSRKRLDWLSSILQAENVVPFSLVSASRSVYRCTVSGIAYFGDNGALGFKRLTKPPWFHRTFTSPLVRVYKLALHPLIVRINGSPSPFSRQYGEVTAISCVALLLAAMAAWPLWHLQQMTKYGWELKAYEGRILHNADIPREIKWTERPRKMNAVFKEPSWNETLVRLSDRDLYRYITLTDQMLKSASPAECAGLGQGTLFKDLMNRIAESDPTFLQSWFEFREILLIESSKPAGLAIRVLTEDELRQQSEAYLRDLPPGERGQLLEIAETPEKASEDDLCWIQRAHFTRLRKLGELSGSILHRTSLKRIMQ